MNQIVFSEQAKQQALTMSTRLVAELTGKEHFNVKRDCDVMFKELEIDALKFEGIYLDSMNRQQTEYLLPKDLVETLITGYSIKLRYQVIQRLHELENQLQPKPTIPQTYSEALQLAADQAKQLEIAAPKLQYFDTVVERSALLNATQVAQKLRLSAIAMNKILDTFNVYSHGVKRARIFQQWFIDSGFGELKQTQLGYSQPMFTTKGEAWIVEKFASRRIV